MDAHGTDAPDPKARRTDSPDAALVDAALAGDRAALDQLLRRHHRRIHLLCHRICADRGDAEDATQNALIAIVRGLEGYDGRSAFTTWSHRVATNACLDELRRRGRRDVPVSDDDGRLDVEAGRTLSGTVADPADLAVGAEQRTRLQSALARLPEEFRVPVVLRDVADMDYAEIAEVLDLAPGTVRSRISRGRSKLAQLLGGPEGDSMGVADDTVDAGNRTGGADVRTEET